MIKALLDHTLYWIITKILFYAIGLTFGVIGVMLLSKYQGIVEEAEAEESESEVQTD